MRATDEPAASSTHVIGLERGGTARPDGTEISGTAWDGAGRRDVASAGMCRPSSDGLGCTGVG